MAKRNFCALCLGECGLVWQATHPPLKITGWRCFPFTIFPWHATQTGNSAAEDGVEQTVISIKTTGMIISDADIVRADVVFKGYFDIQLDYHIKIRALCQDRRPRVPIKN